MARSKNATALFEVIHTAKKPPKSSPDVAVPTPKWWSKNKASRPASVKQIEASHDHAGRQGSWLAAAAKRGVLPTAAGAIKSEPIHEEKQIAFVAIQPAVTLAAEPEMVAEVEEVAQPIAELAPKPRFTERFAERFAKKAAAARENAAVPTPHPVPHPVTDTAPHTGSHVEEIEIIHIPAPVPQPATPDYSTSDYSAAADRSQTESPEPNDEAPSTVVSWSPSPRKPERDTAIAVDRPAGEVRFRLSYAGLIAFGFIFIIVLVIAFLAGLRSTQSANDISSDPKHPVDYAKNAAGLMAALAPTTSAPPVATVGEPLRSDVLVMTRHPSVQPPAVDAMPSPADVKSTREVGSLYVVVQSYPEQELAQKACDYLNHAGVPCSLVQGLQDWAPRDWYSVVGLQPFTKRDLTLPDYERAITSMGQKFSRQTINQFEPHAYTWRTDSEQQ